jgi:DNA polymerase-1
LSSANPNLQNITDPKRIQNPTAREIAETIRRLFVAPEDHWLLQFDYSQAELRIIADLAKEVEMIAAYERGEDIHAITAATFMDMTLEQFNQLPGDVRKTQRYHAKAGNFGLIYRISPEGFQRFARQSYGVRLTLEEATERHHKWLNKYAKIEDYHALYVAKGLKYGYVRTLFGRKRHLPAIKSNDSFDRGQDERRAINSPVQGTAGEMTIFSIALLHLKLDPRVRLMNTVHDSVIYAVPKSEPGLLEETMRIIKETAENLPTFEYFDNGLKQVKMVIDFELSDNSWADLKELK